MLKNRTMCSKLKPGGILGVGGLKKAKHTGLLRISCIQLIQKELSPLVMESVPIDGPVTRRAFRDRISRWFVLVFYFIHSSCQVVFVLDLYFSSFCRT